MFMFLTVVAAVLIPYLAYNMFWSKKWDCNGKHCYVTGGSEGLGLATAVLLAQRGANVSIVARTQSKLNDALKLLHASRVSPTQKFHAHAFNLSTAPSSREALEAACVPYEGRAPDAIFACAGAARPMLLVDMTEEDMERGMVDGYWLQAWTIFAALKMVVRQRKTDAKFVLVGSTLSLMSIVGYASYTPAKHALRGLVDTLESEFLLYPSLRLTIHAFFAPTMSSPGLARENSTKPPITTKLEETDEMLSPERAATVMLAGIDKGHKHITATLIASIFRASTRGSAPRNNFLLDGLLDFVGFIAIPIWRMFADSDIKKAGATHMAELEKSGFIEVGR